MGHFYMRSDTIGTGNGMCNGYFYGFRARQDDDLKCVLQTATEDRERRVRYFAKDGIALRYKMYTAKTKCFKNDGGIQDDYQGSLSCRNEARKRDEREGHRTIAAAFANLYAAEPLKQKKMIQSMEGLFLRVTAQN